MVNKYIARVLHFTFSYRMEGVTVLATPSVVMQTYPFIRDKREKKDISIITALQYPLVYLRYTDHILFPYFPFPKFTASCTDLLSVPIM